MATYAGVRRTIAEELTSPRLANTLMTKHKDGLENPYGSEAMYEEREAFDLGFQEARGVSSREIQSKSRFFSVTAEHV